MEMDSDNKNGDDELKEREVQQVTVRTLGVHTGGPKEAGKKLITTKCVQKLGDTVARLHVMAPFFQQVKMRNHMC